MIEYYWELIQHDGTRIEIPPSAVEVIKRRWDAGQPIHTARSGSVPANQIKAFRPTEKLFLVQPLLDSASQAFNEPQINEDGSIAYKWVKKNVTQDRYNRYYVSINGYQRLGEDGSMVTIAFRLPTHDIDVSVTSYCDDEEIRELENKR